MNCFYIDIATVPEYENITAFKENDIIGYNLFVKKYNTCYSKDYDNIDDAYISKAPLSSTFGKIVNITCGFVKKDNILSLANINGDEKVIVSKLNDILNHQSISLYLLTGFNIIGFDIPYILHKMYKYNIKPAYIINMFGKKPYERRVIDISDIWNVKYNHLYTLNEVVYELNLSFIDDNNIIDGKDIPILYYKNDMKSVEMYCSNNIRYYNEICKRMIF